jgi:type I restriction enzyme, S subunit
VEGADSAVQRIEITIIHEKQFNDMNVTQENIALPRYPVYKHSGVEWLGEIPEGWEVKRLAVLGSFSKGGGFSKAELTETGEPAILYGDIYTKYDFKISNPARYISTETSRKSVPIQQGDILFTGSGETIEDIGKCVAYANENPAFAGGDVIIFRQRGHNSSFISYFMNTESAKAERAKTAKGEIIVHTYGSKLREISICLPPHPEQRAIAAFLDEKTSKIDRAIAQKEKLIALLKERKQIIIQNAVTKGLDPAAKMKDSGVDWIGDIPEGWEVAKLGFIAKIGNGSTPNRGIPKYWEDGNIPWLNSSQVNKGFITESDQFITRAAFKECHLPLLKKGDLVMAITGEGKTRGMVAMCEFEATINQHLACIVLASKRVDGRFLLEFLRSIYLQIRSDSEGNGSTKGAITCSSIKEFPIPVPSLAEQLAIVHHIETQSQKIDASIALQEKQIGKLKEYKAVLIDGAVTGKIKVC